ncbi:DUF2000 domain-containing protein [uncultured Aquitalea sp.]|uniref:DUF2000 domain-containing protein n=1 Tax=uncultured Aquitalea sp. TaxID=540272 RepID=UPI0025D7D720|nr:DUF2000 domain-containing protein [uncultured Aquitalea sp.]
MTQLKCVLVLDGTLPGGVIANTAAILALSLGRRHPELVGEDLPDAEGRERAGITRLALPVLKATPEQLSTLRQTLHAETGLTVVEVTSATRTTRSYEEYAAHLAVTPETSLRYQGLALYGPSERVTGHTGSLPLLR